jgi:diguanylate cyclase (GGDEF)-like protein
MSTTSMPLADPTAVAIEPQRDADVVLFRSERTCVRRVHDAHTTWIRKQALGAEAIQRLHVEQAILARLSHLDGVPRLRPGHSAADAIDLVDDHGVTVAALLHDGPLPLPRLLALGIELGRILARVHLAGVIHLDVNPSNLLVAQHGSGPLRLIDFNIASAGAEQMARFAHQRRIAGTLAYLAPEQSGRTGRALDARADLYAFGATLFEMATGRTPFDSNDVLELVHCHLATPARSPGELRPELPPMFCALVLRLLQKEPERRFQSADGVVHDLQLLLDGWRRDQRWPDAPLGRHDFAPVLRPPAGDIGRADELGTLEAAFARACTGQGQCVLIEGPAGIGKTALVDAFRPHIAARSGWFVAGRFAGAGIDAPSATVLALRALGQLLLSEPEERLAPLREALLRRIGPNLGFGLTEIPEFRLLLGAHERAEATDPVEAETRMIRAAIDVLRCVASIERPLVMLLADLQCAPPVSLRFIDALLDAAAELPGLLLLLTHRSDDAAAAPSVAGAMQRWSALAAAPQRLTLPPLDAPAVTALVGQMLRLPTAEATRLGGLLHERAAGNPQDTADLINGLRADGLLTPGDGGWRYDEAAIRRFVGDSVGVPLLQRRLQKLPAASQHALQVLACLGGSATLELLEVALDAASVQDALAPALDEGLLTARNGSSPAVRLCNARVQQALSALIDDAARRDLQLTLARRLARHAEHERLAAQQYLGAVDALSEADERRRAAQLLHDAADAVGISNSELAERLLSGALQALQPLQTPQDLAHTMTLRAQRHSALYALARIEALDAEYERIVADCRHLPTLAEVTGVQISSLTWRGRPADGMTLGMRMLEQLGMAPPQDIAGAIREGLGVLKAWSDDPAKAADLQRPEPTDPQALAVARFVRHLLAAAFSHNKAFHTWLMLTSLRLWIANGPSAAQLLTLISLPMVLVGALQDQRGAYRVARHALAVGQARGYERAVANHRLFFVLSGMHWMEPLEAVLVECEQAREGLTRVGDVQYVPVVHNVASHVLFDCARTLEDAAAETETCLAFEARIGNRLNTPITLPVRQACRALRGQTRAAGRFEDDTFDEQSHLSGLSSSHSTAAPLIFHVMRLRTAAIFGDDAALQQHAEAAMQHRMLAPGTYIGSMGQVFHTYALICRLPSTTADALLVLDAQVNAGLDWLAARAEDAPANYLHLLHWLRAERAAARGERAAALDGFEAAVAETARRSRPAHQALIVERMARFLRKQGWSAAGRAMLARARRHYDEWGASGKVRAMEATDPWLRDAQPNGHAPRNTASTLLSPEVLDTMAILRASQALSSQTSLQRLHAELTRILGAMCGAEQVQLLVRPLEMDGWYLAHTLEAGAEPLRADQAAARGLLPLSVLRYVERVQQPLVVDDVQRDDRFASDPALASGPHASLLAVPIVQQGGLRTVLLLENRTQRGAFSTHRLETVSMIAGQLAVSVDNALLYASLERKVAQRTAALEVANQQLAEMSRTDALTGLNNRRCFNETLEAELLRCRRTGDALALLMVDVDLFKPYNDRYGHLEGDRCLKAVAQALKHTAREGMDFVARFGGEEFVVLAPAADAAQAVAVAERIRDAVAALREPHADSPHGVVTVSIGAASFAADAATRASALLDAADAALYQAKRLGRNRVHCAP